MSFGHAHALYDRYQRLGALRLLAEPGSEKELSLAEQMQDCRKRADGSARDNEMRTTDKDNR